ncbi:MAG: methionyl-tRNA formyltransferase [candidate division KSB1 bacterium]|nr:methionyl-tRNA formyltransferase [candidate division KSB1 bacterium]MDZ7303505.1 methionyl-tRNA formyltransferase [candidate division KSB1 bacterium]MDZ7312693.1 methionyl-tRNA formyltransferase [candidate division KSB1 bacterium]
MRTIQDLKVVFMGTPEFAVPSLQRLLEHHIPVVGVVTGPDRPSGRGLHFQPTPVKQLAVRTGLPVVQPENLHDPQFIKSLRDWQAEVFLVIGFRILPPEVYTIPALGTVNLHASLLPKYRGAAPIQWAIINGESETGVTTFFIEEKVDVGEVILQRKTEIGEFETAGELHDRLALMGADLIIETLEQIAAGTVHRQKQFGEVSLAPKITKEMACIDWNKSAREIFNFVRGMNPIPGAFTMWQGHHLKIFRTHILNDFSSGHEAGVIVRANERKGELVVQAGLGHLAIDELQIEGKRRMPAADFLRGHQVKTHEKLG